MERVPMLLLPHAQTDPEEFIKDVFYPTQLTRHARHPGTRRIHHLDDYAS
jgi:hypothetical protein